jgi:serine/threonine-protein kinase
VQGAAQPNRSEATTETRVERRAVSTRDVAPTTIVSPGDAIRADEIARVRLFAWMMIALAAFGVVLIFLLGGDPFAKQVFVGAEVICAVAYLSILWVSRNPERYSTNLIGIAAQFAVVAGIATIYYFGVFSPVSMVMALGIYVYALGGALGWSLAGTAVLAGGHGVMAGLIIAGAIDDRGLIRGDHLTARDQVAIQATVVALYFTSFYFGRLSRAKTLTTMTELDTAVREIAAREALVHEARMELDRAEWVEGPGRYSEHTFGSFRLGNVIGRGAMGEIYDAVNKATGEPAAVKLLHVHILNQTGHVERFFREASVAASVDSPHVARVLELVGVDGEVPYLAMERLRGRDLSQYLRDHEQLDVRQVVDLVQQVGRGLDAARAAGVVHRDLKPQNLFFAEQPDGSAVWKILDFGVSKLAGSGGTLTQGHVVGTPAYMSPEQARGGEVDHRTDLYALTAIAYRCLTGQPAFTARDVPTTLYRVVHAMPRRPSDVVDVNIDVERVLAIGLAKRASRRFDGATELADALVSAARGTLDPALRARADRLIEKRPWGEIERS